MLQGSPSVSRVTRWWTGSITAMAAPGSAVGSSASAALARRSTGSSATSSGRMTYTPPGKA